jgi:mono/diheme cytochrome c family protein
MRIALTILLPPLLCLAPLVAACGRDAPATVDAAPPAPIGSADLDAQSIFAKRCSTCHGPAGKGDGTAGAQLNPRPRDFTKADWQQRVTDDQIRTVVVLGGRGVGKSLLMPANPDLEGRSDVVDALVRIVRGFGPK